MKKYSCMAAVAAVLVTPVVLADNSEINALKQQLKQLENRLEKAEQKSKSGNADNSFNPAVSMVLQGGAASYSKDEEFHLEGMPLGGHAGLKEEGLHLWETELTLSANVDNLFYGQATLGIHNEGGEAELDVEEAYVDTLSLPGGVGLRFGRFFSATGYLNEHHAHAWDFVDAPLPYLAFLGGQHRDDGVRVSWLAPTDELFVEVGAEVLNGESYPGGEHDEELGAARNLFAKVGGDVGSNSSWQFGLSHLRFADVHREGGHGHDHGGDEHGAEFEGDSAITTADFVWKTQFSGERGIILQAEYLLRNEDGEVHMEEGAGEAEFEYDGKQYGWYLQGVYQFNRQWRVGLRYDTVYAENDLEMESNTTGEADDDIFEESGFHSEEENLYRWSAMVDWSPSEFSRLRLQYTNDESGHESVNRVYLQYIMTLGAHGAHRY